MQNESGDGRRRRTSPRQVGLCGDPASEDEGRPCAPGEKQCPRPELTARRPTETKAGRRNPNLPPNGDGCFSTASDAGTWTGENPSRPVAARERDMTAARLAGRRRPSCQSGPTPSAPALRTVRSRARPRARTPQRRCASLGKDSGDSRRAAPPSGGAGGFHTAAGRPAETPAITRHPLPSAAANQLVAGGASVGDPPSGRGRPAALMPTALWTAAGRTGGGRAGGGVGAVSAALSSRGAIWWGGRAARPAAARDRRRLWWSAAGGLPAVLRNRVSGRFRAGGPLLVAAGRPLVVLARVKIRSRLAARVIACGPGLPVEKGAPRTNLAVVAPAHSARRPRALCRRCDRQLTRPPQRHAAAALHNNK